MLITLYDLGLSSQAQGDLVGAAEHLKEGLALAAGAGDLSSVAYYLEQLAAVAGQQDIPDRALRLFRRRPLTPASRRQRVAVCMGAPRPARR
jgi:uncharacterized protein HemY